MAAAVVLCFLAGAYADELSALLGGKNVRMEYETRLFDTDEVITVDIRMDEDAWAKMLSNAVSEEYYVCDVTVNGKTVKNVAIRPKGNTSLSAIAKDPNSDRYSLKLEFDHFVKGQTCWGLDKLILNNNYADATNMKEAVIYDMYQYLGADASLYNYAKVSVNGEYWGVYLALEGVEQSFMLRNFGTQDGELYKPDNLEMGGGKQSSSGGSGGGAPSSGMDFSQFSGMDFSQFSGMDLSQFAGKTPPNGGSAPADLPEDFSFDADSLPEGAGPDPGGMPDMGGGKGGSPGGGRGGSSGGGANLNYTDDELSSYSSIWNGEITGTGSADHRRVVTALKNISEGTDLETYLDVDNVLKYMAVHTFAVNMDSLSGSMAHNYYLYEYNGQLNIFPWDYNLSFGGMSMGGSDATDVVNDAIDTPFSGTQFFDALLNDEEYLARYHEYLRVLAEEYVGGGSFEETCKRIRSRIDTLVAEDPTAFYTESEYKTAASLLYQTVTRRAESILGQLDGSIPSTDAGQRQDPDALIDASDIDISAMGQFDMGFGGGGGGEDKTQPKDGTSSAETQTSPAAAQTANTSAGQAQVSFLSSGAQGGFSPGGMPDMGSFDPGNLPEGFDPGNMPDMGSFDPNNMPDMGGFAPSGSGGSSGEQASSGAGAQDGSGSSSRRGPGGSSFSGMPGRTANSTVIGNLILYGVSLAVILAAILLVKFIKRKK